MKVATFDPSSWCATVPSLQGLATAGVPQMHADAFRPYETAVMHGNAAGWDLQALQTRLTDAGIRPDTARSLAVQASPEKALPLAIEIDQRIRSRFSLPDETPEMAWCVTDARSADFERLATEAHEDPRGFGFISRNADGTVRAIVVPEAHAENPRSMTKLLLDAYQHPAFRAVRDGLDFEPSQYRARGYSDLNTWTLRFLGSLLLDLNAVEIDDAGLAGVSEELASRVYFRGESIGDLFAKTIIFRWTEEI